MRKIVRFEQYAAYPDSVRKIGTVIEIDTDPIEKPVLKENHSLADVQEYNKKFTEYDSKQKWIKSYISFFEGYENIYKRLEDIYR